TGGRQNGDIRGTRGAAVPTREPGRESAYRVCTRTAPLARRRRMERVSTWRRARRRALAVRWTESPEISGVAPSSSRDPIDGAAERGHGEAGGKGIRRAGITGPHGGQRSPRPTGPPTQPAHGGWKRGVHRRAVHRALALGERSRLGAGRGQPARRRGPRGAGVDRPGRPDPGG